MSELQDKWVEIAIKVSTTPFIKIRCPNCNQAYLEIRIIPWPGEAPKVDIYLICRACNSQNVITKEVSSISTQL
jgi:hypothetical protein